MRRHGFCPRKKTATAQKGPSYMVNRTVPSVMHVLQIQIQCNFHDTDIIAMDETCLQRYGLPYHYWENRFKRSPHEIDWAWQNPSFCLSDWETRWNQIQAPDVVLLRWGLKSFTITDSQMEARTYGCWEYETSAKDDNRMTD